MVLESHLLIGGDGRGSDVLSSNPPAVTSPGANKIGIVFGLCFDRAANGTACPWLLCFLAGLVSLWCFPLLNCLFGQGWGAEDVPLPLKYLILLPLCVHLCIMHRSWLRRRMTWLLWWSKLRCRWPHCLMGWQHFQRENDVPPLYFSLPPHLGILRCCEWQGPCHLHGKLWLRAPLLRLTWENVELVSSLPASVWLVGSIRQ